MQSQHIGKSSPPVWRTLSWWLIGSVLLLAALWVGPRLGGRVGQLRPDDRARPLCGGRRHQHRL